MPRRGRVDGADHGIGDGQSPGEAQAGVQDGAGERLKRVEAELTQARESAAAAREEAAKLRGQAEALTTQHAELMQVLKEREGERPCDQG
jgi:colicin import membrane protein